MSNATLRWAVLLCAVVGMNGCGGDEDRPPAIGDCTLPGCVSPTGGSSSGSPDASVTDAPSADDVVEEPVATTDISGRVVTLLEEDFSTVAPLLIGGRLQVPSASGDNTVRFGDQGDGAFSASNVVVGPGWFRVVPDVIEGGIANYMPTYSYLTVPDSGSSRFEVPVLDRTLLETLVASLAEPVLLDGIASQIIVVFERGRDRVAGVRLTKFPTAEVIAYDQGVGYAADATETGLSGTVLLINATGAGPIEWKLRNGETRSLTPVHVPGQATFIRIAVE